MRIASSSLQTIINTRPDLITQKVQQVSEIIPMAEGVGDIDSGMYTLNSTDKEIWMLIDGKITIEEIVQELLTKYDGTYDTVYREVLTTMMDFDDQGLIHT